MSKPVLFTLFYRGPAPLEQVEQQLDESQLTHDANRCAYGDCVIIGHGLLDPEDFDEVTEALTHETFHHIFASWFPFLLTPEGYGTLLDIAFDQAFNPVGIYLLIFSLRDEFTQWIWDLELAAAEESRGASPKSVALLESP